MTTVQEHIEWLQKSFKPDDVIAAAIWQVDDVLGQAKQRNKKITRKQAEDILHRIHKHQSAELGITWETINAYLDYDLED